MKFVSPYLLRFSISAILLTLVFRYVLSIGINDQDKWILILAPVAYGALMFVTGWIFGKKDSEYLPIFDIGFRFHFATYLIHNIISICWVGLGYGSKYESLSVVLSVAAFWAIFLTIHFLFYLKVKKHTISSLHKEDIFE